MGKLEGSVLNDLFMIFRYWWDYSQPQNFFGVVSSDFFLFCYIYYKHKGQTSFESNFKLRKCRKSPSYRDE
jgi:hypothetical protein